MVKRKQRGHSVETTVWRQRQNGFVFKLQRSFNDRSPPLAVNSSADFRIHATFIVCVYALLWYTQLLCVSFSFFWYYLEESNHIYYVKKNNMEMRLFYFRLNRCQIVLLNFFFLSLFLFFLSNSFLSFVIFFFTCSKSPGLSLSLCHMLTLTLKRGSHYRHLLRPMWWSSTVEVFPWQ